MPAVNARLARFGWRTLQALTVGAIAMVTLGNLWVVNNTEVYLYSNFAALPENEVGLVLGTSPYTGDGEPNPHFTGRVAAAVELYQLGRVKHLIVSGANPDASYNEPRRMWQALTSAGVPSQAITMDFAGFRTFDSMARAKLVFGLDRLTVITQDYHAYRALFIGKKLGMHPVAYSPAGESSGPAFKPYLREIAARVWAIFDLYLFDTAPKFVGEPVPLPVNEVPQPDADGTPTVP